MTVTHAHSDWSNSFMYGIHETHFLITKHLDQELSAHGGISFSQFLILLPAHCHGRSTFQSEIATMLHLTEATVSGHVNALSKAGLLSRSIDPENKRKKMLKLTTRGEEEFRKAQTIIERALKNVFEDIPGHDRSLITHAFDQVVQKLLTLTQR